MSGLHCRWAWKQKLPATPKLVLLALADFAREDSGHTWPSQERIAEKCALSTRTVYAAIQVLSRAGLVLVKPVYRDSMRRGTDYYLPLLADEITVLGFSKEATSDYRNLPVGPEGDSAKTGSTFCQDRKHVLPGTIQSEPSIENQEAGHVQEMHMESATAAPGPCATVARFPSEPVRSEPGAKALSLAGFSEWYSKYPRKIAKERAIKSWARLTKAGQLPSLEAMLRTLDRQVRENGWALPSNRQYVPYPATYLNDGRYADCEGEVAALASPQQDSPPPPLDLRPRMVRDWAKEQDHPLFAATMDGQTLYRTPDAWAAAYPDIPWPAFKGQGRKEE